MKGQRKSLRKLIGSHYFRSTEILTIWRTNRKSHTCFRLVPKSSTLDDLQRPIRTRLQNRCVFWERRICFHSIFNEDRPILSAVRWATIGVEQLKLVIFFTHAASFPNDSNTGDLERCMWVFNVRKLHRPRMWDAHVHVCCAFWICTDSVDTTLDLSVVSYNDCSVHWIARSVSQPRMTRVADALFFCGS